MTRSELVAQIAQQTQLPVAEVATVVDTALESIIATLINGDKVTLSGFGRFEMRERAPKTYVNPRTQATSTLGVTRTPGFHPSGRMKQRTTEK